MMCASKSSLHHNLLMLRSISCALAVGLAVAAPPADRILSLPSYGAPADPQYSGYLNGGNGQMLHYWYVKQSFFSGRRSDEKTIAEIT